MGVGKWWSPSKEEQQIISRNGIGAMSLAVSQHDEDTISVRIHKTRDDIRINIDGWRRFEGVQRNLTPWETRLLVRNGVVPEKVTVLLRTDSGIWLHREGSKDTFVIYQGDRKWDTY